MPRALVVGDSLTAGRPGVGYVPILNRLLPGLRIAAAGRGGDTVAGVSRRLPSLLGKHAPDILVIEVGANDLLLPWFRRRGGDWRNLADRLARRGSSAAADALAFEEIYVETAAAARAHGVAIVLTTITCLGERADSEPNRHRDQFNRAILATAEACGARVADTGQALDEVLGGSSPSAPYLLDSHRGLYLDSLLSASSAASDWLSRRRGLTLTVDGVHLNGRGAEIFARTTAATLMSVAS